MKFRFDHVFIRRRLLNYVNRDLVNRLFPYREKLQIAQLMGSTIHPGWLRELTSTTGFPAQTILQVDTSDRSIAEMFRRLIVCLPFLSVSSKFHPYRQTIYSASIQREYLVFRKMLSLKASNLWYSQNFFRNFNIIKVETIWFYLNYRKILKFLISWSF